MNENPTENCFLTTYHSSILHGALVGADDSLWPLQKASNHAMQMNERILHDF
jgi:hypothetical protein